ncbi:hypothetical protein B6U81_06360 [Thermoplasmatales archaeon ex4484_30]|nr:MAG: hypothetical protein B6U81_06360 [Thermoplasmatales archaeon ex4484_30]
MEYVWDLFVSMLLLVFAIGTIIAGIFTAYFGSGKSRAIGGVLFIIGIIIAIIFYNYSTGDLWGIKEWSWDTVKNGISAVIGAVIGALIALGVFLAGIMKA